MDLSIHRISTEAFDYRHKKFDHVRSSPTIEQSPLVTATIPEEDAHSMAGTPSSNSAYRNGIKRKFEDIDTAWEPTFDGIEQPWIPVNRRRMQFRCCKQKSIASYEQSNAPKKQKAAYNDRSITPEECMCSNPNLMPKIAQEALVRICQYNQNMVRKFPKKERTIKDQERRDKNTIACRVSRRMKKIESLAIEDQHKTFSQVYFKQYKETMHAGVYLNELLKFGAEVPPNPQNEELVESIAKKLGLTYLEKIPTKTSTTEVSMQNPFQTESHEVKSIAKEGIEEKPREDQLIPQQKPSFSIAYLLGAK